MFVGIPTLIVVTVVSVGARTIPFAENGGHNFETVAVRSSENRPGTHSQCTQYTNNNRGFNRGQEHTHDDSYRKEFVNQRNAAVSDQFTENSDRESGPGPIVLNFELRNGDGRYEIQLSADSVADQHGRDVNSFNIDFYRRQNTNNNNRRLNAEFDEQRSDVQGNYEIKNDENDYLMSKIPIEVFDRNTEYDKTINKQNHKIEDSTQMTQNRNRYSDVRTDYRNTGNRTNEEIHSQNNRIANQTVTAISNNDNKSKTRKQNSALDQNTNTLNHQNRRTGVLNDQNINFQEINNKLDTNRSTGTEKPIPTISNKDNRVQPKVTQDNEVTPKTSQEGRMIPSNGPKKQYEVDRWIWSDTEKSTETTTVSSTTVNVDDRAAFTGDPCPTGKIRFGNACVDKV